MGKKGNIAVNSRTHTEKKTVLKQLNTIANSGISTEKKVVFLDRTNLPGASNINSSRYRLRRSESLDYKKLSQGSFKKKENIKEEKLPGTKSLSSRNNSNRHQEMAETKEGSPLLIHKPIYIVNNSPLKRSSPPNKKLEIYEFEIDENEPKQKLKKKRGPKPGGNKRRKNEIISGLSKKTVTVNKGAKKPLTEQNPKTDSKTEHLNNNSSQSRATFQKGNNEISTSDKRNFSINTVEVPVLFHNHQDSSPPKKVSFNQGEKASFSAMSDDDEIHENTNTNCVVDYLFSDTKQQLERNQATPYKSSLVYDNSYDCPINASTPVKYNYNDTCSSNSIQFQNCFGFDEPELFEEPLVSPIKMPEAPETTSNQGTSNKEVLKMNSEREEIPVEKVLMMLKYGAEGKDKKLEVRSSSSSNSVSPIFKDTFPESEEIVKPKPINGARRSYERPSYLRKINRSFGNDSADEDSSDDTLNLTKKEKNKKKQGQSKKEQDEMQKWIQEFNSQCEEVENFDLVVE